MKNQEQLLREAIFKFVLLALFITFFLAAGISEAKADQLILGFRSHHIERAPYDFEKDRQGEWNENNKGIGLSIDRYKLTGIVYKNSYHDMSFFAGKYWHWLDGKRWQSRFHYGVVVGYDEYPVMPSYIVDVSYKITEHIEPTFILFGNVMAVALKINF